MNPQTISALVSISAELLLLIEQIQSQQPDAWAAVEQDYASTLAVWKDAVASIKARDQNPLVTK